MTHLGESLWMVSGSRFKGKIRWSVGSKGIIRVITEDMASWLRAFATIAEDPGLGLSMHTMVYNLSIPGNLTSLASVSTALKNTKSCSCIHIYT